MEIKTLQDLVRKFGEYKLRSGDEIGFDCPKCGPGRKKFHLGVNLKKRVWHCFKCTFSGHFGGGIKLIEKPKLVQREVTARIRGFRRLNLSNKSVLKYLRTRGLSYKRARRLGWGTCTDQRYKDRLIIPIFEDKEITFFVARSINGGNPKELSPKKDEGWAQRSEIIYGIDRIQTPTRQIVVVEGIFDAEHLNYLGYTAVSILGSHISEVQVGKILSKRPEEIAILLDADDAGYKGTAQAYSLFLRRFRGRLLRGVPTEGQDPDDMTPEQLKNILGAPESK